MEERDRQEVGTGAGSAGGGGGMVKQEKTESKGST